MRKTSVAAGKVEFDKLVAVRMSTADLKAFQEAAEKEDMSVSEFLRSAALLWLVFNLNPHALNELKVGVVEKVKTHFRAKYPIIEVDGVRILFPHGWGLVRASNTQDVLVLRFEAGSKADLNSYRAEVEEQVSLAKAL